ncbi:MAG: type I pullulanase [Ruminococcus sp.]|nr:type I pullulanase [Ruminococcus sp.]
MYKITNYEEFDKNNAYDGNDLGVVFKDGKTQFRTWSPLATAVYLNLYTDGEGDNLIETLPLERHMHGVWYVEILRDIDGDFYTFTYEFDHKIKYETIDIYAKACGVNGNRGAVLDMSKTNPYGWEKVARPVCLSPCDAVIYECHVRDFSADKSSGIPYWNKGKFLAFTETGTKYENVTTCLDHIKDLGVTHVHLLPVFDYATVDESKPHKVQYNWGYDPKNYNCLEGSYSTDATEPKRRINEFKQLIMALHKNGIGVIMDVVYNHTYFTEESAFHKSFPYYYHRLKEDGKFSNGSGCGNETASEHLMMRRFMINSLKFLATEYKLDGFRFDLMGLHDIETVNMIRDELNQFDPTLLMYGEGWTGGESPLPYDKLAYKFNSYSFGSVGLFNDNLRDAIKGGTFNVHDTGYISGNRNVADVLKRGIVGSVPHWQLKNANNACWAVEPTQTINYCEAHDNNTLWDKLAISAKNSSREDRVKMDKLAAAILMLSQGVPFIQLGQDFLRSKPRILKEGETPNDTNIFSHDSYNAPDFTNAVKWNEKAENIDVFEYYKALIRVRKNYPLLRLSKKEDVERCLKFMDTGDNNFISYTLSDENTCLFIAFNPYNEERYINLPDGRFYIRLNDKGKMNKFPISGRYCLPPISAVVLKKINNK